MDLSWIKNNLNKSLFTGLVLFSLTFSAQKIRADYAPLTAIFAFIALILVLWTYRKSESEVELSSEVWFNNIVKSLDDATQARIYLRSFSHPDDFRENHKQELLKIMNLFVQKIIDYPDSMRIIAHQPSGAEGRDPMQWLKERIAERCGREQAEKLLSQCLKIITSQPIGNSSTVYIIDNSILLYNRSEENNKMKYYKVDLNRSIVTFFLEFGFSKYYENN
jgi:hypothetical protein